MFTNQLALPAAEGASLSPFIATELTTTAANIIWPELLDRFTDEKKATQAIFTIDPTQGLVIQLSPPISLNASSEIKQIVIDDLFEVTDYKQIKLPLQVLEQYRPYFEKNYNESDRPDASVDTGIHNAQSYALYHYTCHGFNQNRLARGQFTAELLNTIYRRGYGDEPFQVYCKCMLSSYIISAMALANPAPAATISTALSTEEVPRLTRSDLDKKSDYFRVLQFGGENNREIGFSYSCRYFLKDNAFSSWSHGVLAMGGLSANKTIIMYANEVVGLDIRAISFKKDENEILCAPKQVLMLQPIADVGQYTFVQTSFVCQGRGVEAPQVDPIIIDKAMRYMHENYFKQPYLLSTLGQLYRGKVAPLDRKSICDVDVILQLPNKPVIYNYNHGPIHALRKVVMLPVVIQFFSEHAKPELKGFCRSLLTQSEIILDHKEIAVQTLLNEIGLVAAWISNGRDNEFSWDDNPGLYTKFREQSFIRFTEFLDSNTSTVKIPEMRIAMYKDILDYLGNPEYMGKMSGFPAFVMHLVNTTQALDMPRTYSRKTSVDILQDRLTPLLSADGMKFIPDLLHYSLSLIAVSGDRILDDWTPDQWEKNKYPRFDSWVERVRLSGRRHEPCFADFSLPEGFRKCRRQLQSLPIPTFKVCALESAKKIELREKIAKLALHRFFEHKAESSLSDLNKELWFLLFCHQPRITNNHVLLTLKAWGQGVNLDEMLAERNIIPKIKEYLQNDPEIINAQDDSDNTALYYSAQQPNTEILSLLLDSGAKIEPVKIIKAAIESGYIDNIKLLIQKGARLPNVSIDSLKVLREQPVIAYALSSPKPQETLRYIYTALKESGKNDQEIMNDYFSMQLYYSASNVNTNQVKNLLDFKSSSEAKISLAIIDDQTALDFAIQHKLDAVIDPLLNLVSEAKEKSAIASSAIKTLIECHSRYSVAQVQAMLLTLYQQLPMAYTHDIVKVSYLAVAAIRERNFDFIDFILDRITPKINLSSVLFMLIYQSKDMQGSFGNEIIIPFIARYKLTGIDIIDGILGLYRTRIDGDSMQKIFEILFPHVLKMNDDDLLLGKDNILNLFLILQYTRITYPLIKRLLENNMLTSDNVLSIFESLVVAGLKDEAFDLFNANKKMFEGANPLVRMLGRLVMFQSAAGEALAHLILRVSEWQVDAVFACVEYGHHNLLLLLLEQGLSAKLINKNSESLLTSFLASTAVRNDYMRKSTELARKLLEYKADANDGSHLSGKRPIILAFNIQGRAKEIVRTLVEHKADVRLEDEKEAPLLWRAIPSVLHGDPWAADILFDVTKNIPQYVLKILATDFDKGKMAYLSHKRINFIEVIGEIESLPDVTFDKLITHFDLRELIIDAIHRNKMSLVSRFLKLDSLNSRDSYLNEMIEAALELEDESMAKLLINSVQDKNRLLVSPIENEKTQVVRKLIKLGVDINSRFEGSFYYPLSYAIYLRKTNVVDCLLENKANINIITENYGNVIFYCSLLYSKSAKLPRQLLDLGITLALPATQQIRCSALMALANLSNFDDSASLIKYFVKDNSELNKVEYSDSKENPLMIAAKAGNVDFVQALLKRGMACQHLNTLNESAIFYAAKCADSKAALQIISMLQPTEQDLNSVSKLFATPLSTAIQQLGNGGSFDDRRWDVVNYFIQSFNDKAISLLPTMFHLCHFTKNFKLFVEFLNAKHSLLLAKIKRDLQDPTIAIASMGQNFVTDKAFLEQRLVDASFTTSPLVTFGLLSSPAISSSFSSPVPAEESAHNVKLGQQ
jgi:ankyrin repeat protein